MMTSKYNIFILPPSHRAKFLRICDKLKVSRQAITDPEGFYYNLVKAGYDYNKIKNKEVHFNGTAKTIPLWKKRELFLGRHLNNEDAAGYKKDFTISRHHLAMIAWAYALSSPATIKQKIDELYASLFGDS